MTVPEQLQQAARAGAIILTANQRLARDYRRRFDEAWIASGARSWTSPRILPWNTWLRSWWQDAVIAGRLPVATILSPAQSEALWRRIIAADEGAAAILQLRATARPARSAAALLDQHRIDARLPRYSGHEDWSVFRGWAQQFEAVTRRNGWIEESSLASILAAALRERAVIPPAAVLLGGFDEMTPAQRWLLDALRDAGCSADAVTPAQPALDVRRYEFPDREEELRSAACHARDLLRRSPESRIGVVIPGLNAVRGLCRRVFQEVLHPDSIFGLRQHAPAFHISLGRPLHSYPLVSAALLALNLRREVLDLDVASAILRCPYFGGGTSEAAKRAVEDARMRRRRLADISSREVDRWGILDLRMPELQTASGWAAAFRSLLSKTGWPGDVSLDSAEFQAQKAWENLLDTFAGLDLMGEPMSFDAAVEEIRELAAAVEFQPEDPGAPVQIMGALEAAGSSFDHLWVAGLEDESWPQPAHPHPFLPIALQIEHDLPHCTPARESAFATRTTARLFESSANIVVSSARQDGERTLRPSPLVREIPLSAAPPSLDDYSIFLRRRVQLEAIDDHHAPPLPDGHVAGGSRILKGQSECPFRAFAEFRLGARSVEEGVLGVHPAERGNALHEALKEFWRMTGTRQALLAMRPGELNDRIQSVARAAVKMAPVSEAERRLRALEVERVAAVLAGWLEVECSREEDFTVELREEKQYVSIGGLQLETRIDRLDRLADGRLVLIDYKSTAPSANAWEGERPSEPQVPLYAVSMQTPASAVAFGQLAPEALKFTGIADGNALAPHVKPLDPGHTVRSRIEDWRPVLESLARDFREGKAPVDPTGKACAFCSFPALCRIHEHRQMAREEDEQSG